MSVIPEEGVLIETKTFTWKMKLSKLLDKPEKEILYSPNFFQDECKWKLSIVRDAGWIGGHLYLDLYKNKGLEQGTTKIPSTFWISMEIVRSESRNVKEGKAFSWIWELPNRGYGSPQFLSFNPARKDDVLEVKCQIRINERDGAGRSLINPEFRNSSIVSDIERMLDDSILTDLTIQVEEGQLKAHKSILAARSPVFRRMFESGMVEAAHSQLIIQDFSAKVVQQMLEFMYSGDESLIGKNGVPLREMLLIAEKYALDQLKGVCEELLGKNLTVENVIKMLILADMQNAPTLKKQTLEYIVKNLVQVVKTEAYLKLTSAEIFREICTAVALHNVKPDA